VGTPSMVGHYSPDALPQRAEGLVTHLVAALVMKPLMEGLFTSAYAVGLPAPHPKPQLTIPICVYWPDT
jgi:hypothetical protein